MEWTIANLTTSIFVGCGLFLVTKVLVERYFKWAERKIDNKTPSGWEFQVSNKYDGKGE